MFVLVACEESQTVCKAFRAKGHHAFSCDIQDCSGGHPEWHIKGDVIPLLNGNCSFTTCDGNVHTLFDTWDLIIAHPPCTYLSNISAPLMYDSPGVINPERYYLAMEAKEFFMKCLNADCSKICVENPIPLSCVGLPPRTMMCNPCEFDEDYTKRTCFWLKGLPVLMPTCHVYGAKSWCKCVRGSKQRSKTFPGIAQAMADQWG